MLRINKLLGLALAVGLLAGCVPLFGQTGGLTGKATLDEGTPCVKCPVIIERQEEPPIFRAQQRAAALRAFGEGEQIELRRRAAQGRHVQALEREGRREARREASALKRAVAH